MKVLIADDTQIIRDRLVRQISPLKGVCRTYQAFDYDSTLKYIEKYKPDILLLDMFMPGGTGLDILQEIKHQKIPCRTIVLTSSPDLQLRKLCMAAGAEDYFLKGSGFLDAVNAIDAMTASGSAGTH